MKYFKALKDGELTTLALKSKCKEGIYIIYRYDQYINGIPVAEYTFKYNLNEKLEQCQSIFTSGEKWEKYNETRISAL